MEPDKKARTIRRLKNQRSAFSADALELWIRQYADSLEDPMKRNELVRIADERRANTDRTIVMIDRELAALEGE